MRQILALAHRTDVAVVRLDIFTKLHVMFIRSVSVAKVHGSCSDPIADAINRRLQESYKMRDLFVSPAPTAGQRGVAPWSRV